MNWNIDAFGTEARRSTIIGVVCRDNNGRLLYSNIKSIDGCTILLAETMVICITITTVTQQKHSHVIIEIDLQIAIQAILSATKVPIIIANIVADFVVLTLVIRNIKYVYYNKYANMLAERK